VRPLSPARTVLNSHKRRPRKKIVGWREWVALPLLGVQAIKAKIDTEARTSALHAFDVEPYEVNGEEWVRFVLSPLQRKDSRDILCVAPVLDRRWVTNPGGRREKRILIETTILLGNSRWPIELGLIRAGVKGITHVMRALGMLPPSKRRRRIVDLVLVRSSTWVRAPLSGVLRTVAPLGGGVERGQVMGIISDPFGMSETEVPATADGIVVGRTNQPLVREGDGLFHIVRVEGTKAAAEALDAFDPGIEYDQGMTKELAADAPIV
jgi:hypothetical protein